MTLPKIWALAGVVFLVLAVFLVVSAVAHGHSLPRPPLEESGLRADPMHDAIMISAVLAWQVGVALIDLAWRQVSAPRTLLWCATSALSLGALMLWAAVVAIQAASLLFSLGAVLLIYAGIGVLATGVILTIRLVYLRVESLRAADERRMA